MIRITAFLLLIIFQAVTSNIKTAYSFTPAELDMQIRRMNEYPGELARLGYILEKKKEVQFLRKLEHNFFTVIDFNEYFPNRLPYILSPLLFLGLFHFVRERERKRSLYFAFLLSIAILSLLGPYAKYGPLLIMPFFFCFILLGIKRILEIFRR